MKCLLIAAGLAPILLLPASLAAQGTYDHGEVQAYGDLFRIAPSGVPAVNYLGVGGRLGINTGRYVALEAELNYNWAQNYTTVTTTNGTTVGTSTTVTASVRPITGLFGPKFQFGSSGPLRAFLVAKAGFVDFTTSCNAPAGSASCFTTSLSTFGGSSTHFSAFPGGGIEGFAGPLGFRVDVGDQIYNNNSNWYNNLRVTFGPTLRF